MPLKKKYQSKIGIIGGGFDPFHLAHLNSILSVRKKFNLKKIIVVPSFQTPLSDISTKETAEHRLEMLKITLASYDFIEIDDQEIKRKGTSYSYRTVENISKKNSEADIFFILGLDQFEKFGEWKNFKRILQKVNLIVTSRPTFKFPKSKKDIPEKLKTLIKTKILQKIFLTTGKVIHFHSLNDKNISSSLVRKKLKKKESINLLVPKPIAKYIKKHRLYISSEKDFYFLKALMFCAKELENQKAFNIKLFDLSACTTLFLGGIIASSSNPAHCKSLARHLQKRMQEKFKIDPRGREGEQEGKWIALDYNELIVHIFYDFVRGSYKLEEVWKGSSEITLEN